jgi:hypothetical protein
LSCETSIPAFIIGASTFAEENKDAFPRTVDLTESEKTHSEHR